VLLQGTTHVGVYTNSELLRKHAEQQLGLLVENWEFTQAKHSDLAFWTQTDLDGREWFIRRQMPNKLEV
jgi:hypothetical protein